MEYRQKGKSSLKSLHPYLKPKPKKLLKIPLAYGRAGIENLIKLLSEEISEPALVNTLSLIRDEMKCQETKSRSIELNLVRVLGRGLRRDWMISEYLSDEEAKHLIQARSLTLDILGDVSTISFGREEMESQNIMFSIVKELTSKHQIIVASATRALSRWTDFTQGAKLFLKEKIERDQVTPHLESRGQDVALWMTEIFANITGLACDDGVKLALRLNVPKHMASFVSRKQVNEKLLNAALRVVCNVSHNIEGNDVVLNQGTMEVVCSMALDASKTRGKETARLFSGALKAMTITEAGKKRVARDDDAVTLITRLVSSEDEFTKTNAVCCIQLASEFPLARKKFVHGLLNSSIENLELVFEARCMKELTKIMLSEDSSLDFKASALTAFSKLCKKESGIKEATQCVCIVEALSSLLLLSDGRVSAVAGSTLAFLSKANVISAKQLAKVIVESGGFENGPDSFGMKLKRKLAVYPGMAGRVLDHVKLFNNSK